MMMMMVMVMMLIVMQQSQLFFVVLELKHVRGFSQDQQVGGSFSFFLSSFRCSDNQQRRNIELTKKQRRLCGSLEEGEAPNSLEGDELHCQGHEGVLRPRPATSQMLVFFDFFSFFFDLGDRGAAGLPLS